MGLRGAGAKKRRVEPIGAQPRRRALPWKKKGLSRVERVIAFLEFTPVTKGIYAGRKMKLLAGQHNSLRRFTADLDLTAGARSRSPSRANRAAMAKLDFVQRSRSPTCWDPNASHAVKCTRALTVNFRPL